jgi:hypothetical protein
MKRFIIAFSVLAFFWAAPVSQLHPFPPETLSGLHARQYTENEPFTDYT